VTPETGLRDTIAKHRERRSELWASGKAKPPGGNGKQTSGEKYKKVGHIAAEKGGALRKLQKKDSRTTLRKVGS